MSEHTTESDYIDPQAPMCACGHTRASHADGGCFGCGGPPCDFVAMSARHGLRCIEAPCLSCVVEQALYDHREDGLTCYDHYAPRWCCPCGDHDLTVSWREHVAEYIAVAVRPRSDNPTSPGRTGGAR